MRRLSSLSSRNSSSSSSSSQSSNAKTGTTSIEDIRGVDMTTTTTTTSPIKKQYESPTTKRRVSSSDSSTSQAEGGIRRMTKDGSSTISTGNSPTPRKSTSNKGFSITKTLTSLWSQPANRSCADCRSALVDPSTVYASFCPSRNTITSSSSQPASPVGKKVPISFHDFRLNHHSFAPPDVKRRQAQDRQKRCRTVDIDIDPTRMANQTFGGHGVFICKNCAEAHQQLDTSVTVVLPVMEVSLWSADQVHIMVESGTNAQNWRIYEAYVPDMWIERRPISSSRLSERVLFCKAKYEAVAFALPPPGPLADKAWPLVVQHNKVGRSFASTDLGNIRALSTAQGMFQPQPNDGCGQRRTGTAKGGLPNRLVDYFCVVSSSMQLLPIDLNRDLSQLSSPEDFAFWPYVSDCYPKKGTHNGDMEFPEHLPSFVLPGGCRPSLCYNPPTFFSFVLTLADGERLYGGALQVYDENMDIDELKDAIRESGYTGELPDCLDTTQDGSDVVFFPKCLLVLSHHAFFDLFRNVLLELYQISLMASPLPIERYIGNFVSEVPLPPQGKVRVEFAFTTDKKFVIERPPINQLPMANFSFRPLFASLSVSNILVVLGCLLEERKVVLLSSHYSMLCPVAEALLSALFPFQWVGLYIPIAPIAMTDILDAPVPYLVGFHSQYLHKVDVKDRPHDAVFVDLDRDVLHMGGVPIPRIPQRDAFKLSAALEEAGGSAAYLIPNSGIKGCIMSGSEEALLVPNEVRPMYARMTTIPALAAESLGRRDIFTMTDLAFGGYDNNNDDSDNHNGTVLGISGFESTHGQIMTFADDDDGTTNISDGIRGSKWMKKFPRTIQPIKKPKFMRNKKADILSCSHSAMHQGHLLDVTEVSNFSVQDIRNAFLRFTVATFAQYEEFLLCGAGNALFDHDSFIDDQSLDGGSSEFLRNILETQLFQRFLEERKENPNLPEVRFFDESIIAKMNRSKKATLANGGKKKPTPFLNDSSWKVTKVFTPPPPSNLGLPDTGETFSYGTFPSLEYTRFGRIRTPAFWRQETSRESWGAKRTLKWNSKLKSTQKEIVMKALKPIMSAPNAIAAVAERAARDLDSALIAISSHSGRPRSRSRRREIHTTTPEHDEEEKPSPPDRGVDTLSKADTIMINARRKQIILLDVVIDCQALIRGYLARRQYLHVRISSSAEKKKRRHETEMQREIQAARKENEIRRFKSKNAAILQSVWRGYFTRIRFESLLKAIVKIQTTYRTWKAQREWRRKQAGAVIIQKNILARRLSTIFRILKGMMVRVQARVRGMLIRNRVTFVKKEKMVLYRSQIFVLWTYAHVPLTLRTKIWPYFNSGESFLRLRLAESELVRLWGILGFKATAKASKFKDKVTRCGQAIGIDNKVYCRSKQCVDWIINQDHSGCKSPVLEKALEIEEAERLQIYERLSSKAEKDLLALYDYFGIPSDEKLKKFCLAQRLWTKLALASRSESVLKSLFPELVSSNTMVFQKPSAKGLRRFPRAIKVPPPAIDQNLWNQLSPEEIMKKHVQEVALLYITKVPALMSKLDSTGNGLDRNIKSFQVAVTKARSQPWEKARRVVMMKYLEGRYTERPIPRAPVKLSSSVGERVMLISSPEDTLSMGTAKRSVFPASGQAAITNRRSKRRNVLNPFDKEGDDRKDSAFSKFPDIDMGVSEGVEIFVSTSARTTEDVREVEFPDLDSIKRGTIANGEVRDVGFPTIL